ncbi:hypothetical protein DOM21_08705 [Bacteriovorax stolpii]|uniref:hypothetical protein n=1 Tax=Bacteriovorax stolpii TaxID=960 RepID=UPI001157EDF2|nr:hypothetical protein [Bacteriovorax stolpii]QDK41529.1 hypothetical protein DOM21_08705 [Bacteriovorax stolpii]
MTDGVRKLDLLRGFYRAQARASGSESSELKEIASELKIANELKAQEEVEITNATGSPYLQDQSWQKKGVLLGSAEETDWKKVKSYEEAHDKTLPLSRENLKKLNII